MENAPKTTRNKLTGRRYWWFLLIFLFPIPFSPWRLGVICGVVFMLLVALVTRGDLDSL
jgi:hypothetical protein